MSFRGGAVSTLGSLPEQFGQVDDDIRKCAGRNRSGACDVDIRVSARLSVWLTMHLVGSGSEVTRHVGR